MILEICFGSYFSILCETVMSLFMKIIFGGFCYEHDLFILQVMWLGRVLDLDSMVSYGVHEIIGLVWHVVGLKFGATMAIMEHSLVTLDIFVMFMLTCRWLWFMILMK